MDFVDEDIGKRGNDGGWGRPKRDGGKLGECRFRFALAGSSTGLGKRSDAPFAQRRRSGSRWRGVGAMLKRKREEFPLLPGDSVVERDVREE